MFDEELLSTLLDASGENDRQPVLEWIEMARPVLQIVGQEGFGKSTRLEACHWMVREEWQKPCVFTYLPLGAMSVTPPDLPTRGFWFLDEAQRLNSWNRRKLAQWVEKSGSRLVIGTHEDLSTVFKRKDIPCSTIMLEPPEIDTLRLFVRRRLEYKRLPVSEAGAGLKIPDDILEVVAGAMNHNLGRAEFILYEAAQLALNQSGDEVRTVLDIDRSMIERAAARAHRVLG
jgi:hypothetical protein